MPHIGRLFRNVDDLLFVQWLFEHGAIWVMLVPHKRKVIVYSRRRLEHKRIRECRQLRNKLWVCIGEVSMSVPVQEATEDRV